MKKLFSLLLVALILVGTFNYVPTAKAIDSTDLFKVTTDGFSCEGTITYTVFLKQGISFSGASIRFKYDSTVLEIKECEAFMTEDSYGDPVENIPGIYESGNIVGLTGVFGCIFMYSGNNDYTAKSSDKAFIQITFKLKDNVFIPFSETKVDFFCYEFVSYDNPKLNIYNGNEKAFANFKNLPKEHPFNNNVCSFCGCLCFEYIKNNTEKDITGALNLELPENWEAGIAKSFFVKSGEKIYVPFTLSTVMCKERFDERNMITVSALWENSKEEYTFGR